MKVIVSINKNSCNLCGICVNACPTNVFIMNYEGILINSEKCIYCRGCEALCPKNAISLKALDEGLKILVKTVQAEPKQAKQLTLRQALKQNNTYNPTKDNQNGAGVA